MTDEALMADHWMLASRQLVNWGSYEGYHVFRPSMDPDMPITLLAGASESGKSTLVDAQNSLLYPAGTAFNKASNSGRSERSDYTYLRGMTAVADDAEGGTAVYLRGSAEDGTPSAVWGAIVDTYVNRMGGEMLSCAKFLYLSPGDERGNVRRQYVSWNHEIDPRKMDGYRSSPFTADQLRKVYPGCAVYSNAENFHESVWTRMGLKAAACRLLYKIQSADAPSRLDDIFKQGVLDVPNALTKAREAVEDYDRYAENFRSMEENARQMDALREIRDEHAEYDKAARQARDLQVTNPQDDAGLTTLRSWVFSRLASAVRDQLPQDRRELERQQEQCHKADTTVENVQRELGEVTEMMHGAGGDTLTHLENEHEQALQELERMRHTVGRIRQAFARADEPMPQSEASWEQRRQEAQDFIEDANVQRDELQRQRDACVVRRKGITDRLDPIKRDFERQSRKRTRITQDMEDDRAAIAQATGLSERDLPYVAELMDVRKDEERWRTAMNVAYGPIAQIILVDRRYERGFARKVSTIDPSTMFRRTWQFIDIDDIDYESGTQEHGEDGEHDDRLSGKLRFREDSPFLGWLREQTTSRRLDALCVEHIDDADTARQIQPDGQIKAGQRGSYGTKGINQVIGFADEAYLRGLKQQIDRLSEQLRQCELDGEDIKRQQSHLDELRTLSSQIADLSWTEVDEAGTEANVERLERDIDTLRNDPKLAQLAERRDQLQHALRDALDSQANARFAAANTQQTVDAAEAWLTERAGQIADTAEQPTLPDTVTELLSTAYSAATGSVAGELAHMTVLPGQPGIRRFDERVLGMVGNAITKRISEASTQANKARASVERRMSDYLARWAADDTTVTPTVDDYRYYEDELEDLSKIVAKAATPEEIANSVDKMQRDFNELSMSLENDQREVREQLDRINSMLRDQQFGPRHGSLTLDVTIRPRSAAFNGTLRRTIGRLNSWQAEQPSGGASDSRTAKRAFDSCKPMVELLRSELGKVRDTAGIRQYGARDLDSRARSSFYAVVHHDDGPDERISSTGGKSGGALQELTSFVYGAALIYLLGGDISGHPTYTTLFLDEALIKADGRYTQRALAVLPRLGFQVIVSAPESKTGEILEMATRGYVVLKDERLHSHLQELDLVGAHADGGPFEQRNPSAGKSSTGTAASSIPADAGNADDTVETSNVTNSGDSTASSSGKPQS